jgi:hypothetical protein
MPPARPHAELLKVALAVVVCILGRVIAIRYL